MSGTVPNATSEVEALTLDAFLNSVAEALAWGRRGWERAEMARKAAC